MPSLRLAATPRLPRTWYFWGSTVFGLLAHGAMLLAQMLTLVVILIRHGGAEPSEATLTILVHQGGTIAVATDFRLLALSLRLDLARGDHARRLEHRGHGTAPVDGDR
jgi:hypothetical protein